MFCILVVFGFVKIEMRMWNVLLCIMGREEGSGLCLLFGIYFVQCVVIIQNKDVMIERSGYQIVFLLLNSQVMYVNCWKFFFECILFCIVINGVIYFEFGVDKE